MNPAGRGVNTFFSPPRHPGVAAAGASVPGDREALALDADPHRAASLVGLGPLRIPVACIDHLIAMTTGTGSGKDLIDIEELRKGQAGTRA